MHAGRMLAGCESRYSGAQRAAQLPMRAGWYRTCGSIRALGPAGTNYLRTELPNYRVLCDPSIIDLTYSYLRRYNL